jgi:hypothetical protein
MSGGILVLAIASGNAISLVIGGALALWAFHDAGWSVAWRVEADEQSIVWRAPFRTLVLPRASLRGVVPGWLGRRIAVGLQFDDGSILRVWRGLRTTAWLRANRITWIEERDTRCCYAARRGPVISLPRSTSALPSLTLTA